MHQSHLKKNSYISLVKRGKPRVKKSRLESVLLIIGLVAGARFLANRITMLVTKTTMALKTQLSVFM